MSYYTEMTASLIGHMAADIILFPLETIMNRYGSIVIVNVLTTKETKIMFFFTLKATFARD